MLFTLKVLQIFTFNSISLEELKNQHNVKVLNFNSEIMKEMFKISRSVITEFSELGKYIKKYIIVVDSLKKYNNYQNFLIMVI